MKNRYIIYYLLMFLSLLIVIILFPLFPDTIPAHYNIQGEVDDWGSKYQLLVFPIIIIAIGLFMKLLSKISSKKPETASNEKAVITIGIATMILFNMITFYFLYQAYSISMKKDQLQAIDSSKFFSIVIAIVYIITGNIMPKCKLNSLVGVRTKWSMANERVWFLSQRFGGIVFVITGIINLIIGFLFLKGNMIIIFSLCTLLVSTIIIVIMSYIYYLKDKNQKL